MPYNNNAAKSSTINFITNGCLCVFSSIIDELQASG